MKKVVQSVLTLGMILPVMMSSGCTKLHYSANSSEKFAPVNVDSVVVFATEEELTASGRKFTVIGKATAEGNALAGKGNMRKTVIARAAKEGADAVVFSTETSWGPSQGTIDYTPTIGRVYSERPHGSGKEITAYFLKFK